MFFRAGGKSTLDRTRAAELQTISGAFLLSLLALLNLVQHLAQPGDGLHLVMAPGTHWHAVHEKIRFGPAMFAWLHQTHPVAQRNAEGGSERQPSASSANS